MLNLMEECALRLFVDRMDYKRIKEEYAKEGDKLPSNEEIANSAWEDAQTFVCMKPDPPPMTKQEFNEWVGLMKG